MKVTIVSTLPVDILEMKPGLIPGTFAIPAAKKGDISLLTIDDSRQFFPSADPEAPPFIVIEPATVVADAVVNDFKRSAYGAKQDKNIDGIPQTPGLFWVVGELNKDEIKKQYAVQLKEAYAQTIAWFQNLLIMADDEWNKNKQRRMITDMQRLACRFLNQSREWDVDVLKTSSLNCWSCKNPVNPEAIVCANCKAIINLEEYNKNKDRFVGAVPAAK